VPAVTVYSAPDDIHRVLQSQV